MVSTLASAEIGDLRGLPQDSMSLGEAAQRIGLTVLRKSSNQPVGTDPVGETPLAAGKRAQIGQDTIFPLEGVGVEAVVDEAKGIGRGGVRKASDRPLVADDLDAHRTVNFIKEDGNGTPGTPSA